MEKKIVKGKFIGKTGKEREKLVQSIRTKIDVGFFSSREVIAEITERLGPDFTASLEPD